MGNRQVGGDDWQYPKGAFVRLLSSLRENSLNNVLTHCPDSADNRPRTMLCVFANIEKWLQSRVFRRLMRMARGLQPNPRKPHSSSTENRHEIRNHHVEQLLCRRCRALRVDLECDAAITKSFALNRCARRV